MISVMVRTGWKPYVAPMTAALLRLLALLALVLTPLGMTGAPAAASPMPASHAMASGNHCDEQGDRSHEPVSRMDCAAMCTALPASEPPAAAPLLKPTASRIAGIALPFDGIEPEIATPPPRLGRSANIAFELEIFSEIFR